MAKPLSLETLFPTLPRSADPVTSTYEDIPLTLTYRGNTWELKIAISQGHIRIRQDTTMAALQWMEGTKLRYESGVGSTSTGHSRALQDTGMLPGNTHKLEQVLEALGRSS